MEQEDSESVPSRVAPDLYRRHNVSRFLTWGIQEWLRRQKPEPQTNVEPAWGPDDMASSGWAQKQEGGSRGLL